jgi:alkylation response protein AidB-like acyl-CoA dehydrogenase
LNVKIVPGDQLVNALSSLLPGLLGADADSPQIRSLTDGFKAIDFFATGSYDSPQFFARKDAAGAILYSAEKATWMAGEAIQALGGNGYINDYPAGRILRDAKLYEIGAGTSEIRRMLIGREIFAATG